MGLTLSDRPSMNPDGRPMEDTGTALRSYLLNLEVQPRKELRARIAQACGVQPSALYNWERGSQPIPPAKVRIVSYYTGIPMEELEPKVFAPWTPDSEGG